MKQLEAFNLWFYALDQRERLLVIGTAITVVITLFYVVIWEPVHQGLGEQQLLHASQSDNLMWMQEAAAEVRSLKAAGGGSRKAPSNQPVSLVLEQSIATAGLKDNLNKIESSGKKGARVKLDAASFDQMLIWLNTLEQRHGIVVTSATIDRADKPGLINARISFDKI